MIARAGAVDWRGLARAADVRPARVLLSILAGTGALGFAVGLAAVAAWLIARAAGMPSPADLAVAAVVVRFFGIGRGVLRYVERLASHDTALRTTARLRATAYEAVARSGAAHALSLKRGDIVARTGADVDAIGDVLVRAIIPAGVAVTVSLVAVAVSAALLPAAGLALAGCLLLSAVGATGLSWRSARRAADAVAESSSRVTAAALEAIESGTEHRVWGDATRAAKELHCANRDAERAIDYAARPAALGAAVQTLAAGAALVAGVGFAVGAAAAGSLQPTSAAVVALLPLAAFEAVSAIPGAVAAAHRARAGVIRLTGLTGGSLALTALGHEEEAAVGASASTPVVELREVSASWPGMTPTRPVSVRLLPGGALGIVGRSGIGKSTLLLTIAGALTPRSGEVLVGGKAASAAMTGSVVALTPEDAHIFGTSVLENLRVARGDVTPAQARTALEAVGLQEWLDAQSEGLDTLLGAGGGSISGGERRRLLLARALLTPAPIHLIDEPAEHLDADGIDALRAVVREMRSRGRSVVIVTHDLGILDVTDEAVSLDD